jgi:hypothetical protein
MQLRFIHNKDTEKAHTNTRTYTHTSRYTYEKPTEDVVVFFRALQVVGFVISCSPVLAIKAAFFQFRIVLCLSLPSLQMDLCADINHT